MMFRKIVFTLLLLILIAAGLFWLYQPETASAASPDDKGIAGAAEDAAQGQDDGARHLDSDQTDSSRAPARSHGDKVSSVSASDDAIEPQGYPVFGRVVHAETGQGIVGAQVVLKKENPALITTTAAGGEFLISDVPKGHYHPLALREGLTSFAHWQQQMHLDVPTSGTPLLIEMYPAVPLLLQVLAEAGDQPLANVAVRTQPDLGSAKHTDQDGMMTLDLAPGTWTLVARLAGYAQGQRAINLKEGNSKPFVIRLSAGGSLVGRVIDTEHQPIEGAYVVSDAGTGQMKQITEADGRFRLDGLPLNKNVNLLVFANNYQHQSFSKVRLTEEEPEAAFDVIMKSEPIIWADIGGQVVNELGAPIQGVTVTAFNGDDRPVVQTDRDGRFHFPNLGMRHSSTLVLGLEAEGYAVMEHRIYLRRNKAKGVTITMKPAHWVSGHVVDSAGDGVAHARILLVGVFQVMKPIQTDVTGAFHMDRLPPDAKLRVIAKGYGEKTAAPGLDRDDVLIEMVDEGRIAGRVVDGDTQQPVKTFNVKVIGAGNRRMYRLGGIDHQSEDGRFVLDGLRSTEADVVIEAPGYPPTSFSDILPTNQPDEQLFPLNKDGLVLVGRVVDSSGTGLSGIPVTLLVMKPSNKNWDRQRLIDHAFYPSLFLDRRTVTSDDAGVFRFEKVPEDLRSDLVVVHEAYAFQHLQNVALLSEENQQNLLLTLVPGGSLEVIVKPEVYPHVVVSLSGSSDGNRVLLRSQLGVNQPSFVFTSLPAMDYEVTTREEQDVGMNVDKALRNDRFFLNEGEHLTLRLGFGETHPLRGVAYSRGQPAGNRHLFLRNDANDFMAQRITMENGFFEIPNVPEGHYTLSLSGHRFERLSLGVSMDLMVTVMDAVDQRFDFPNQGLLTGMVDDSFTSVSVMRQDGTERPTRNCEVVDNTFVFYDLSPGRYQLSGLMQTGGPRHLLVFEMPADGADLDLGLVEPNLDASLQVIIQADDLDRLRGHLKIELQNGQSLSHPFHGLRNQFTVPSLPRAPMTVQPNDALWLYRFTPSSILVDTSIDVKPEIVFRAELVWLLQFKNKTGKAFKAAYLVHPDGTRLDIPLVSKIPDDTYRSDFLTTVQGLIRGTRDGEWTLFVTTVDNQLWKKPAPLIRGNETTISIGD